jgi:hypothetical protein
MFLPKDKRHRHSFEVEYDPGKVVDCGTNITLFKALAAMNDENDREQWFIGDAGMVLCPEYNFWHYAHNELENTWCVNNFRKATVEEIIEHFKNWKS